MCRKTQATIFISTPTFLRAYLKRCEPDDFRSLRLLMCGAEKLPQPLAQEFLQKFGIEPLEGYGCTELSPGVSANVPDREDGTLRQCGTRRGTIGQARPRIGSFL